MIWQLIETAPRNKKIIAGYKNSLGNWRIIIATFYDGTLQAHDDYDGDDVDENGMMPPAWYEETESQDYLNKTDYEPTHWMPLPKSPEDQ